MKAHDNDRINTFRRSWHIAVIRRLVSCKPEVVVTPEASNTVGYGSTLQTRRVTPDAMFYTAALQHKGPAGL